MSTKKLKPKKGMVLISGGNAVLVTGPGNKKEGYPCFSGVVVMASQSIEEADLWPVGMYSDTWSTEAFKSTGIKIGDWVEMAYKITKFKA